MAIREVAMTYTRAAVERAMKVAEVLLQALKSRQPWIQVAETLGVSARTVRRWRHHYEKHGFDGLFDHRRRTPSPRAVQWRSCNECCTCTRSGTGASTCGTFTRSCAGSMGWAGPIP